MVRRRASAVLPRYRETPLHEHAAALRQLGETTWYADPAGRTEIEELRASGLVVRRGDNDIRPGIAAVTARLRTGRLKVKRDACSQLLTEARLYRYPSAAERVLRGENPVDEHNHALAALRYLISRLDAHFIARLRKPQPLGAGSVSDGNSPVADASGSEKRRDDNEHLWTRLS